MERLRPRRFSCCDFSSEVVFLLLRESIKDDEAKMNSAKTGTFLKAILSTASLLLVSTFAPTGFGESGTQDQTVQPAISQPSRAHKSGEGPFAGLNLSDDQKAQIKKIHEDAKAKADAAMSDPSLSDAQKQTKVKEIHRAARKQAHGVLTPEQRQQLKANRRESRTERSAPAST
jgi:Spy/CpxP family protein refolding chaperone